jgi:hypothetical protein
LYVADSQNHRVQKFLRRQTHAQAQAGAGAHAIVMAPPTAEALPLRRPKGATQPQPRATPWDLPLMIPQALRGRFKPSANPALKPPLQGLMSMGWRHPGRCPGLRLNCPFGAGEGTAKPSAYSGSTTPTAAAFSRRCAKGFGAGGASR